MVITDIQVQRHHTNRFSIFLDGQYAFGIEDIDCFRLGLSIDQQLTEQQVDNIIEECIFTKAKQVALNYVSYQRRTVKEVENKLKRLGFDENIIQKAVVRIVEMDYLNDERFVIDYAHNAQTVKKWGSYRIKNELRQKGIPQELLSLVENSEQEHDALAQIIQKKVGSQHTLDYKEKNRIIAYCSRRGFAINDILQALSIEEDA